MLTKTTDDLRTTLLKIITPLAVLSDVIRALAGKLGIEIPKIAKPGTPAPKVPKPTPPSKVVKTPGGRFKPEGMKGPGFIKEADAAKKLDDVVKQSDDLLKSAGRTSKFVRKIAVPVGLVLDAVEVGTVAMDKNKTKGDVAASIGEKATAYGGAALGAKGGAIAGGYAGALLGPVGAAVGAAVGGLIGGIGGYFAGEEVGQTVIDKTAGMSSGQEADQGVSKVLEEFADLDKQEREEFYKAMSGGQQSINDFIEANSGFLSGFTDMGELVQVMQEVAKNTNRSVEEIANLTRE